MFVLGLVSPLVAHGGCDLLITSAGPCLADGRDGIPHVGDAYAIKVVVRIVGTPAHPFRIKWTMANLTEYYDINVGAGEAWWWPFIKHMDLDGPIPWSVTLDPDGVSGDTDLSNNTARGVFTPVPPETAVELYSPKIMDGIETRTLVFKPDSGNIPWLYVLFGVPTTHGSQQAISFSGPSYGKQVVTPPNDVPVFEVARLNVSATTFTDSTSFSVRLHRIRVNPTILRAGTWAGMDALGLEWKRWLAPDQRVQPADPQIAAFVRQSLPADYRKALTPYDTARALHLAVMKKLSYKSPPGHLDAVGVLQDGVADCGGFAALLTACLRHVGIPSRCISGFREGKSVWHVRVEFHLPGAEWIVADPCDGDGCEPTGTYAYCFGNSTNADQFVAVDTGDSHVMPYHDFTFLQVPNWWWSGGGAYITNGAVASLHQP